MDDERDRRAQAQHKRHILRRRARLLGAALAGAGLTAGLAQCSPCLSVQPVPKATVDVPRQTSGTDAGYEDPEDDAGVTTASGEPDAATGQPCLSVSTEPAQPCLQPQVCLSRRRPPPPPPPRKCLSMLPPSTNPQACLWAEPPEADLESSQRLRRGQGRKNQG